MLISVYKISARTKLIFTNRHRALVKTKGHSELREGKDQYSSDKTKTVETAIYRVF